jgi:hypothetical protein
MMDCLALKLLVLEAGRLSEIMDGIVSVRGAVGGNHSKCEKPWLQLLVTNASRLSNLSPSFFPAQIIPN